MLDVVVGTVVATVGFFLSFRVFEFCVGYVGHPVMLPDDELAEDATDNDVVTGSASSATQKLMLVLKN